jgi:hypothetical protein
MRAVQSGFVGATLFVALALICANDSDAAWPGSGRKGSGAVGANYIVASINFPSGAVGGVGCASLSSCIADTRSTTATYVTSAGGVSTAAVNTPRIDCSNATCGLLNEGAATNLALNSANIGGTGWGETGNYGNPTITQNNAVAPDGTTTASKMALPQTNSGAPGSSLTYSSPISASASTNYTVSAFLKGNSGGEKYYEMFAVNGSPYTIFANPLVTLTASFSRYAATGSSSSYTSLNIQFGVNGQTGQPASTSYLWGLQFEAGSFATSYIPTTSASASRAADSMSAAGPLASAMSAGQSYVDMIDEATGATSRTLYAAGAFNWPPYKWITQICVYSPSVGSSYLTAHSTYGTSC